MRVELEALRDGYLTFRQFADLTRREWERLGAKLLRRWRAPAGVELADLTQELLVASWQVLDRYDPERGVALERFVIFNAVDRAKKWLHRQRAAKRRDDKAVSRHPLAFAELLTEQRDVEQAVWRSRDLGADDLLARVWLGELLAELSPGEQDLVVAWFEAGCDATGAAEALAEDPLQRLVHRSDVDGLRRLVTDAVEVVLAMADAAA